MRTDAAKCAIAVFIALRKLTSLTEDGGALSFVDNRSDPSAPLAGAAHPKVGSFESAEWFAAYTLPRHEKAVARQLEVRYIESFLPLYRVSRRWRNGCTAAVEHPLFPSYIFVSIERCRSVNVLQVPGVLSIVSAGRELAALPSSEIDALRLGLPLRHFEPHPYLVVGEKARIVSGSLAGMVGVLVRKKNHLRVVLTLDLIRQSVAVEVGIDEIEPLKQ
jgi:transcription antitermination factor NusG